MVSFQRMKDDLDDLGTHVSNKLPPIGRAGCLAIALISIVVVLVIGIGIGVAVNRTGAGQTRSSSAGAGGLKQSRPTFVFVSNNSYSCPELKGNDRLLTTVGEGQSFEGLVVNLACRGDYNPFPNQIKCRRKSIVDEPDNLEWSHVPVCYPSVLVSKVIHLTLYSKVSI